jgi:hypothetical protein
MERTNMKTQWACLLLLAPALSLLPATCGADPVDLGVGGNLSGEYSLGPNQSISENFTLDYETQVTSLGVAIMPELGGLGKLNGFYQVTLTGSGGTYSVQDYSWNGTIPGNWVSTPLPAILPAGQYILSINSGACGDPCLNFVAGIDYYIQPTYSEIGGSVGEGYPGGNIGWRLTGETVPEPSTWVLIGTALLYIPVHRAFAKSSA